MGSELVDARTRAALRDAADKAMDYLASNLDSEGRHQRAPNDAAPHYKLPYLFAYGGRRETALRVFQHLEKNLINADGTFRDPAANLPSSRYLYWASWMAWGATALGRFDVARQFMRKVTKVQDAKLGGLWQEMPFGRAFGVLDTSAVTSGCAAAGEVEAAVLGSKFLAHVLDAQQDPTRLYYYAGGDGKAITVDTPDPTMMFYDTTGMVRPAMLATVLAGLVWTGRRTGDSTHFATARRYADIMLAAPEPVKNAFASKTGWAALQLYTHRPDADLLAFAQGLGQDMLRRQLPNGSVDLRDWPGLEGGPPPAATEWVTVDWTLTALALANGAA